MCIYSTWIKRFWGIMELWWAVLVLNCWCNHVANLRSESMYCNRTDGRLLWFWWQNQCFWKGLYRKAWMHAPEWIAQLILGNIQCRAQAGQEGLSFRPLFEFWTWIIGSDLTRLCPGMWNMWQRSNMSIQYLDRFNNLSVGGAHCPIVG